MRRRTFQRRAAPRPTSPASGERFPDLEGALAAALALATVACWIPQFRFFFLPNNDFASLESVASSLARLELPTNYQRLPLLPGAMALVAPLLTGRHALLDAALLVNVACAAATLPLLYAFAARTVGRGALLLPVLFAGTALFHAQGLQPLMEPSLGLFVVLAFVLFQRRSPWQYAAAGMAALSRYDAVVLLGIFAGANALEDGRWRRHAALAALAAAPFALWLGLGALRGSGAATYTEAMAAMHWAPAPHVLATLLKESFRGWWSDVPGPELPLFLLAVGIPCAVGVGAGVRYYPRESAVSFAYLAVSLAAIVALGVDKARYVYPLVWIPQLFFAAGLLALLGRLRGWLQARPIALGLAIAVAVGALLGPGRSALAKLATAPEPMAPTALDLAYLGALALLATVALVRALDAPRARRAAATCVGLGLAAVLPLLATGTRAKASEQYKIRWVNYDTVIAAAWLEEHIGPEDSVVTLSRQHFLFLTGWAPARVVPFQALEAEDVAELATEMRQRGLDYVVATWRKPVAQPIDRVYERQFKWFLADPFASGGPVAGFEHVAALPLPAHLSQPPVQVYRVVAPQARDK